jgi:predicted unusual protein kinase regulating ubiquinone biosynthesis (AarF/ABC1/UbiB family)
MHKACAGFFHGDPHPGNLLLVTEGPDAGKLALLDFGLVAEIPVEDREAMVSATIHLANKDWCASVRCSFPFLFVQ